jgi:hypothetical protein
MTMALVESSFVQTVERIGVDCMLMQGRDGVVKAYRAGFNPSGTRRGWIADDAEVDDTATI